MSENIKSFKESIRHFFFKYTLIPIFILLILFSVFIFLITKINIVINSNQAGKNISNEINTVYNNYYNETITMATSPHVIDYITKRKNSNLVFDEYYKFNNEQKIKSALSIIDTKGVFLISTSDSSSEIQNYILKDIIPKMKDNPDILLTEINKLNYNYNKETTYTFAKPIKEKDAVIGYLVYQLFQDDFQGLLFQEQNDLAIITDNHNRVIATNNNSVKGLMNKFIPNYYDSSHNYVEIFNNKYYLYKNEFTNIPIHIYTLNSMTIKKDIFLIYIGFMLFAIIIIVILTRYLGEKMSYNNSKSIDKLIYSVQELKKGNLNSYVNIHSGDEFEVLGNEYNIMLDNLNDLIKKNEELTNLSYMSEIKLLQAQFNPHFIFNILETLKYSIVLAPKECEKIIINLSKLLRYSINYENKKVTLNKDLNYIKCYLDLSKFRFKDKFNYSIDISNNAEKALIPKLLLQVFVENSIKYAYKDKDNLQITIFANVTNNNLVLQVKDDGSGMTSEQLCEINSILLNADNASNHIGLHNAYRRLVLLYGNNQTFKIDSTLGLGTTITLTLPYEEENLYV